MSTVSGNVKGISEAQMVEFRRLFNKLDKDYSGSLDKNEFRALLLSLGYKLGNDPIVDPVLDRIFANADPNHTGYVSFESFMDFITRESVDGDDD